MKHVIGMRAYRGITMSYGRRGYNPVFSAGLANTHPSQKVRDMLDSMEITATNLSWACLTSSFLGVMADNPYALIPGCAGIIGANVIKLQIARLQRIEEVREGGDKTL